jgi:trigger factor
VKSTVLEPKTWKRVIEIEAPAEELDTVFEEKLAKVRKELSLPGFRPGKVPAPLIKQRYGESIRAEAIEEMVQKIFKEVCTEKNINPISRGVVNDFKAEKGQPLVFKIETEIDPEIEIKGYEKLKIKAAPQKIKDSDIDEAVKNIQERFAEFKDIDRASKKGDYVRLEYLKVMLDGQERNDVKNPSYPVELGAEHRIKDFDKGLIGHTAGETVELSIKFPGDYADKEVAGTKGEFTIKITAVQEKIIPEVESFLKKLGDFENEEALRTQLRKQMETDALQQAKTDAHDKAIDTIIKQNDFEVPPSRIEAFIDYVMEQAAREQPKNQPLPSRDEVSGKYRETAVRTIKRQRIIDYIAQKEKISATQEEVDVEINKLAVQYNQPFETFKQTLRKNGTTLRIREDLRERKTLDFLIDELPVAAEK